MLIVIMASQRFVDTVGLAVLVIQLGGAAVAGTFFTEQQRRDVIAAAERLTEGHLSQLTRDAEAGDAGAQLMLAVYYSTGRATPPDPLEASRWLQKAAAQGHPMALDGLGVSYARGEGVPHDDSRGLALIRQAAEMGYAAAQNRLGVTYAKGDMVPRDPAAAVSWYFKAAEQRHVEAQYNMAQAYDHGIGVAVDHAEAAAWLRAAAKQNDAPAQFNLAVAYRTGEGTTKSLDLCEYWLEKASDQEYAAATYYLGVLASERSRFAQESADKHFVQAATQGYALAALALAERTRDPRLKHREAYKWLLVAQGLEQRTEWRTRWAVIRPADADQVRRELPGLLQKARKKLTAEETATGEQSAQEFLTTYGPRRQPPAWP
jgi:TPR repeat protein